MNQIDYSMTSLFKACQYFCTIKPFVSIEGLIRHKSMWLSQLPHCQFSCAFSFVYPFLIFLKHTIPLCTSRMTFVFFVPYILTYSLWLFSSFLSHDYRSSFSRNPSLITIKRTPSLSYFNLSVLCYLFFTFWCYIKHLVIFPFSKHITPNAQDLFCTHCIKYIVQHGDT